MSVHRDSCSCCVQIIRGCFDARITFEQPHYINQNYAQIAQIALVTLSDDPNYNDLNGRKPLVDGLCEGFVRHRRHLQEKPAWHCTLPAPKDYCGMVNDQLRDGAPEQPMRKELVMKPVASESQMDSAVTRKVTRDRNGKRRLIGTFELRS
jgi:hypothetical protein